MPINGAGVHSLYIVKWISLTKISIVTKSNIVGSLRRHGNAINTKKI